MAMTSTGTPFERMYSGETYYDQGVGLSTNTVFYFNVASQTGSVIQFTSQE